MTIPKLMAIAMGFTTCVWATEPERAKAPLTLCVSAGNSVWGDAFQARTFVTKVYARIGVEIAWAKHSRNCIAGGISIELREHAPADRSSEALACATGEHVTLFYDRAVAFAGSRQDVAMVMGFTLVHEIAHVLEGNGRHSSTGIMKAAWTDADKDLMRFMRLEFSAEDVALLRQRLNLDRSAPAVTLSEQR